MTNEMQIFSNPAFGEIRTMTIKGEPWAVGKDVAAALGYTNPQKAVRDHVDADDKTVNDSFTVNGTPLVLINESGLYSLIFASKLPAAKEFKRWVTSEVLPAIRKYGAYSTKATAAEARLLRERNREKKLDNDRFALELKSAKLYGAAKGADKAVFADLLRRNGINVPEEAPPEPEPDIDFEAAQKVFLSVGEAFGEHRTYKRVEYLCVVASTLRDALEDAGYDAESVLRWASKSERIRIAKDGGVTIVTKRGGKSVRCVWVRLQPQTDDAP